MIYSVTSDDDSIDDSEYDLLLPTCVRWSSWRLSDCSEYNASESESESEDMTPTEEYRVKTWWRNGGIQR